MNPQIPFIKIEATGNDFIFFDIRDIAFEELNPILISYLCQRRLSIGADGLILMNGLKMHYFNADGSIGAMCGNGLRAATLFAYHSGKIKLGETANLHADDGIHEVCAKGDNEFKVEIRVPDKHNPQVHPKYILPDNLKILGSFDTGVPHLVIDAGSDLDKLDVQGIGKKLRFDSTFQPHGTNVNFISISKKDVVQIRTYERGVEAETLACGTGATATFLAYEQFKKVKTKTLNIHARGGLLRLTRQASKIYLDGKANIAYSGYINLESNIHQD